MVTYQRVCVVIFGVYFICVVSGMTPVMRFMDNIHDSLYKFPNEGKIKDTTVFEKEYDFVVVGAGTGGSVVANRLTEIPEWEVLLLEAGDDEPFYADIPASAPFNSMTDLNWGYKTDPVKGACLLYKNHSCVWPRGRVMGGTSVLNGMLYSRGSRNDYDNWAAMGNTGWSYDEILPYFKKSEDMRIKKLKKSKYHGVGGYVPVEEATFDGELLHSFKTAGREMGYKVLDYNGKSSIGFSKAQAMTRNGRRCSASKAFLESIRGRPNLHISKLSRVIRILIDPATKTAIGVEFIKNHEKIIVKARKEVILSGGTIGSAHLLLLSGVGPRKNLQRYDIPVIKDSPVGYNLQDHAGFFGVIYLTNQTSFVSLASSPDSIANYILNQRGPLSVPATTGGFAFMKSKYSTDLEDAPDIEIMLVLLGMNQGPLAGKLLEEFSGFPQDKYESYLDGIMGASSVTLYPILVAPKSRGRLSLKSSNPFHWPRIQPKYFQDERDIQTLREAAKMTMKIAQTSGFRKLGARMHDRKYPGCEQYDLMSDKHWECAIRQTTMTLHHQVGTAKMGPSSDPTAVVDPRLKVIGISGLRVIDASIMPVVPRGHTNAVVTMIAEKATDMIKEDWLEKNMTETY